jgi:hypothetical protein
MKNKATLMSQLDYWTNCIEMLGPEETPTHGLFEQPMAGLRLVRKPQATSMPWSQKNARKTKSRARGLL